MKISGTEIEIVTNPYSASATPIDCEYKDDISSILVKGPWHEDIIDFMQKNQIRGLYLNYAKGFECSNFDFLCCLPELELLNIIYTPVDSLKPVESLVNLKSLSISCHWKDKIDLTRLNNLLRCFIGYDKGAESVFECLSLKYLYIDNFKLKDYSSLKNLTKIEYLTIGNSSFNTPELLGDLPLLRKLVLLNCRKLDRLIGVDRLGSLEWLTIDGSRQVSSLNELSKLKHLKILQLSNNKEIDTLTPIKGLVKLKSLSFFGDTKIADGDFSFLEELPSLSLVGFAGRRHYTHKPARPWNWGDYDTERPGVLRK